MAGNGGLRASNADLILIVLRACRPPVDDGFSQQPSAEAVSVTI